MRNTRTAPNDGILEHCVAITAADADLATTGVFVYVGVTGDLKITAAGGGTETFKNVPVGWFPMRVDRVWAASTASELIAGW